MPPSIATMISRRLGNTGSPQGSLSTLFDRLKKTTLDVRLQAILREIVEPNDRCGKPRSGAEAERPARAEATGDPTDDRRPDGGAAQEHREKDCDHPSTHDGFGR